MVESAHQVEKYHRKTEDAERGDVIRGFAFRRMQDGAGYQYDESGY